MTCKNMPRSWKLKDIVHKLNSKCEIKPTPGLTGVQQSLKARLVTRIECLIDTIPEDTTDYVLRVRLNGDGTKIGRNLHVINFTFTLPVEARSLSAAGNHTIAILKVPEKYEELFLELSDITREVEELDSIEVNGINFKLEVFLSGDWKFLALILGLDAANSTYSCLWCSKHGACSIEEIIANARLPKSAKRYNCSHRPIFPSIPLDHIVIDTLHLFLRITDLLTNLLIQDIRSQDGIDKRTSPTFRTKATNMVAYEKFLNETCKIPFQWHVSPETKQLKWRDLTGPEKPRLFAKIQIPQLFPSLPHAVAIQEL